jgi:hypothetical protein
MMNIHPPAHLRTDPYARLPDPARAILQGLRDRWDELDTLNAALHDKWQAAHQARGKAAGHLATLTDTRQSMAYRGAPALRADHPAAQQAQAELDAATIEFQRVTDLSNARAHTSGQLRSLLDKIDAYLASLRDGVTLAPYNGPDLKKPKPGEDVLVAIERCRKEIAGLQAELASVRAAPIMASAARQKVRDQIEALAARGRPDAYPVIEYGEDLRWAERVESFTVVGVAEGPDRPLPLRALAGGPVADTLGLIVWLHRDLLLAKLDEEINAVADDAAALNDTARSAKLESLRARLLAATRQECGLIKLAHGEVAYRPETDPRAILELADSAPPPSEV